MAKHRIAATETAVWAKANARREDRGTGRGAQRSPQARETEVPDGHVVVACLDEDKLASSKTRELTAPLKRVINVALPLVPMPPLVEVSKKLLAEFPHAKDVVRACSSAIAMGGPSIGS